MNDKRYKSVNYPIQADAAKRMWAEICSRHPIIPIPEHPGPRPPWWRWRSRRRWERVESIRRAAKTWNFAWLYGANIRDIDNCHGATIMERKPVARWRRVRRCVRRWFK